MAASISTALTNPAIKRELNNKEYVFKANLEILDARALEYIRSQGERAEGFSDFNLRIRYIALRTFELYSSESHIFSYGYLEAERTVRFSTLSSENTKDRGLFFERYPPGISADPEKHPKVKEALEKVRAYLCEDTRKRQFICNIENRFKKSMEYDRPEEIRSEAAISAREKFLNLYFSALEPSSVAIKSELPTYSYDNEVIKLIEEMLLQAFLIIKKERQDTTWVVLDVSIPRPRWLRRQPPAGYIAMEASSSEGVA